MRLKNRGDEYLGMFCNARLRDTDDETDHLNTRIIQLPYLIHPYQLRPYNFAAVL